MSYELVGQGSIPFRSNILFSLLHSAQTGSGPHPAFYQMGIAGFSTGVKRQGHEADHSLPPRAEVKNGGAIPPLLHTCSGSDA
jgi:hypothetical protein